MTMPITEFIQLCPKFFVTATVALLIGFWSVNAHAAVRTVDCNSPTTSLATEVAAADPGDVLNILGVCTANDIIIDKELTLNGASADAQLVAIIVRGVLIDTSAVVNIKNLKVTYNGVDPSAVALDIPTEAAQVNIENCSFLKSGLKRGTAINSTRLNTNLHITNSTVSGYDSGINFARGTLDMRNSTITNNLSGIAALGSLPMVLGQVTIIHSTISNHSSFGLHFSASSLQLANNILVGNFLDLNYAGVNPAMSGGYNIIGVLNNNGNFTTNNDTVGANNVLLGALADNGGPTPTQALIANGSSDGIAMIPAANCLPTDQRNAPRPGAGKGTNCDVGAYETGLARLEANPVELNFGAVSASGLTLMVTYTNTGNSAIASGFTLPIQSITPLPNAGFEVTASDLSGLAVGQSHDVSVAFTPIQNGPAAGSLAITAPGTVVNNPVNVPLSGTGVGFTVPITQQIAAILAFIEVSSANGDLYGIGAGNSASNRLKAFNNMMKAANGLIQQNQILDACVQLKDALGKTDGNPKPPDFVDGTAKSQLVTMIQNLITSMGCP